METFFYTEDRLDQQAIDYFVPLTSTAVQSPAIVFIHGGLWTARDKADYRNIGSTFANSGVATFLVNYRLSGADSPIKHPDHVRDCAKALNWLSLNERVASAISNGVTLIGHSCGATMAALLKLNGHTYGLTSDANAMIKSVVGISGLYDLKAYADDFPDWISEIEISQGRAEGWDYPVLHKVTESSRCQWLLLHAPDDKYVNIKQTEIFSEFLLGQRGVVEKNFGLPGGHYDCLENVGKGSDDSLAGIIFGFINSFQK